MCPACMAGVLISALSVASGGTVVTLGGRALRAPSKRAGPRTSNASPATARATTESRASQTVSVETEARR
jgi:hypothetical protein